MAWLFRKLSPNFVTVSMPFKAEFSSLFKLHCISYIRKCLLHTASKIFTKSDSVACFDLDQVDRIQNPDQSFKYCIQSDDSYCYFKSL